MNTQSATKRVAITAIAGFVLFLTVPLMPTFAATSADVTLGTSANYSLVSGGVIVLGVSTSFTGVAPIKVAISPGIY